MTHWTARAAAAMSEPRSGLTDRMRKILSKNAFPEERRNRAVKTYAITLPIHPQRLPWAREPVKSPANGGCLPAQLVGVDGSFARAILIERDRP